MSSQFAKKIQMQNYERHVKRLQSAKPSVDSSKPINKKPQGTRPIIQRRLREEAIIQENQHMLDRLAKVMQSKRIDNDGGYLLKGRKSLTGTARKHQLQRITEENHRLLQRIQKVNPVIDHVEFDTRAKKNKYMLRQLSEFKETSMPPEIKAWLREKNKQLRLTQGLLRDDTHPDRLVYTRGATGDQVTVQRRSQSARVRSAINANNEFKKTKGPTVIEDSEQILEGDRQHKTQNQSHSKRGNDEKLNKYVNNKNSPMRGRIRPKSGRI